MLLTGSDVRRILLFFALSLTTGCEASSAKLAFPVQ